MSPPSTLTHVPAPCRKPAIRQTGGLRYAFGVADAYEMFRLILITFERSD